MWSGRRGLLRSSGCGVEELRCRRREREAALRKARREQQLVSKRLLRDEATEEAEGGCVVVILGEAEIQEFLRLAQRGTEEKERERALVSLRRGLQHPETQQTFIRLEGSIRTLVGLLTSNQALLQLEAARCLHELSHSEQSAVAEACLPATSYLLTYLSGHSSDFIELCLYTLGNLIVESEAVRRQLLPQGIVPALAACIQSPHLTVLEALGYALSQLLQAKEAPEKIIPLVLGSTLPQHILQLLQPGPKLNLGVAVEFAWCLHYIICSQVNNALLITQGALTTLGLLLLDLAAAVQRTEDAGLELVCGQLVCPVVRCLSNLLTEAAAETVGGPMQLRDERVLAALFILLQFFLHKQPSLLPEGLWLLNNLTANSPSFCTSLISLDLIEPLLHLLSVSNVVSVLVLTVLCNVAEKGPAYCQHLWPGLLLPTLLDTLALSDTEVVGQSLELLQLLFLYQPGAAQAFLQQSGLQALQRHEEVAQLQDRVHALQQTALHG
ncbi:transmembrane and coiled-coil domain-containing protein 6 isoform X1 [Bos indicus x Bos taurus]|uniref:transmembrane and coiled-coil domain-containing protein 6 isoform X1 n=1 Tax=Bos indicus x Bos taurus TaxID=30522 RepID=UPI000952B7B6|nr:PREDICTED: transmembrane and coiled-coil domain-containing protein 6 isoform X1 [Bos indicus]XP_027402052.1 transmembrane and coiled-coil domain-containing protein 6 isoform X1 [Bos indicus x Bos taurus]XP_061279693.1 transmembrane and coiled-coil domain-containing protein 6 isoform X1 [Bos javanicus]